MKYKAVLFDMDGIIFNTEPIGVNANIYAAKEQGYDMLREVSLKTLGQTAKRSMEIIQLSYPNIDADKFQEDYDYYMDTTTAENVPFMPFALETINLVHEKNLLCGLCSSNSKQRIMRYLKISDMLGFFDAIVTGDDGAKSKPAPDMYLLLAKKLSVEPESCLVLEDSPAGIKAAHFANMDAYMVPDLIPYDNSLAPFTKGVLKDLKQAMSLLS